MQKIRTDTAPRETHGRTSARLRAVWEIPVPACCAGFPSASAQHSPLLAVLVTRCAEVFPAPRNSPRHQLGALHLTSVLTGPTWRERQAHGTAPTKMPTTSSRSQVTPNFCLTWPQIGGSHNPSRVLSICYVTHNSGKHMTAALSYHRGRGQGQRRVAR